MNYFVVVTLLIGVGTATSQKFSATSNANEIVITRSENENSGDGTFKWASELSDGSKLEQSGYVKPGPDPENPIQVIQGSYSYITPDGETINLKYIADENGFQPEGIHLPTPPPIPEEIQKVLRTIQGASSNQVPQFRKPASQPRRF